MVQVLRPIRGSSSEWGPASAWPHQCVTKFLNLCHVVNLITPTPPGSNSRVLLKPVPTHGYSTQISSELNHVRLRAAICHGQAGWVLTVAKGSE